MLLHIIFIQHVSIISANSTFFSRIFDDINVFDSNPTSHNRESRQILKKSPFEYDYAPPTCEQLSHTGYTPFVVLLLYKTSGRFLGMGSVIDKRTVLTAGRVVLTSLHNPQTVYVLAGRLSPWWGKDSQVKQAQEIYINDDEIALVILKNPIEFTRNVMPIKIPNVPNKEDLQPEVFVDKYDRHWGVFGIPRTGWDAPGELMSKTGIYIMNIESVVETPEDMAECRSDFPDVDFNDTVHACTYSNGSIYRWGSIGSPVVALDKKEKIQQIGVVVRATTSDKDDYHVVAKVPYFDQWIRSHSLLGFKYPE